MPRSSNATGYRLTSKSLTRKQTPRLTALATLLAFHSSRCLNAGIRAAGLYHVAVHQRDGFLHFRSGSFTDGWGRTETRRVASRSGGTREMRTVASVWPYITKEWPPARAMVRSVGRLPDSASAGS